MNSSQNTDIDMLPDEVLLGILHLLNSEIGPLLAISQVSKKYEALSSDDSLWGRLFALYFPEQPFPQNNFKRSFLLKMKEMLKPLDQLRELAKTAAPTQIKYHNYLAKAFLLIRGGASLETFKEEFWKNLNEHQKIFCLGVVDGFNNSLLETAAILGKVEIVKFLLSQLKDDSFAPIGLESFGTALLKIIPFQNIEIIQAFLEKYRKYTSSGHYFAKQLDHILIVRSAIESFKGNLGVFDLLFNFVGLKNRQEAYGVLRELLYRPRNANNTVLYEYVFSIATIATPHMNMNEEQKKYCLECILSNDNEHAYAALSKRVSLNIQNVLDSIKYRDSIRIISYIFHSPNFELEPLKSHEVLKNAFIKYFKNYILSKKSAEKLKTEFNEKIYLLESAVEKAKIENFYSSKDCEGNTLLHSLCDSIDQEEVLDRKEKEKIKTILYFLLKHNVDLNIKNNKGAIPSDLIVYQKVRKWLKYCIAETMLIHQHNLERTSLMEQIKSLKEETETLKKVLGNKRNYDQIDPITPTDASKKVESAKSPKISFFDIATDARSKDREQKKKKEKGNEARP